MKHDLYTLAYLSQNAFAECDADPKAIIGDILGVARRRNASLGVTGALLCSGGWFAQVLEGAQNAVEKIFQSIQVDDRHKNVEILYFKPLRNRDFPNWSMAFAGLSDDALASHDIDGMVARPNGIDTGMIGQDIVRILTDLISRQELAGKVKLANE